jgi:hypothetical protein
MTDTQEESLLRRPDRARPSSTWPECTPVNYGLLHLMTSEEEEKKLQSNLGSFEESCLLPIPIVFLHLPTMGFFLGGHG